MTLSTVEEWDEAFAMLAREREAYNVDPHRVPLLLGVEHVDAMRAFMAAEAVQVVTELLHPLIEEMEASGAPNPMESAVATHLVTSAQMYLEFGLWLAQKGLVKP